MEDMECIGAEADDAEVEYIRDVCENELVGGTGNLLDTFAPLVLHLCKNPSRYPTNTCTLQLCLAMEATAYHSNSCSMTVSYCQYNVSDEHE